MLIPSLDLHFHVLTKILLSIGVRGVPHCWCDGAARAATLGGSPASKNRSTSEAQTPCSEPCYPTGFGFPHG